MKVSHTQIDEIKLIGITARTSLAKELNEDTCKIPGCVMKFFHEALFEKIPNRLSPGKTYSAYTEYESDYTGEYTYFLGEEVSSFDNVPEGFSTLTIPPQRYAKFTTDPGPMPQVVQEAWQDIWEMTADEQGGPREYIADFEVYDERATDPSNLVLDIYIGVKAKLPA